MTTDRIERTIRIEAPRARVWRAITDATEFGAWFGVRLDGAFTPGGVVRGAITNPAYRHLTLELTVERIEPEHLFSYRWHPAAIVPGVDYGAEPTTLVEFRLADDGAGTRLAIVESGFDRIPLARRAEAYRLNDGGWKVQADAIARHVTGG